MEMKLSCATPTGHSFGTRPVCHSHSYFRLGASRWDCRHHAAKGRFTIPCGIHARRQQLEVFRRKASQDEPYDAVVLSPCGDATELDASCQKLARHVEAWLNEEWTPLDVHHDLANEAAAAYKDLRLRGENELGSILLGLSTSLLTFDFHDTFVNAFEVSNKVAELLMLEEEREVCCRSETDRELYDRIEQEDTKQ